MVLCVPGISVRSFSRKSFASSEIANVDALMREEAHCLTVAMVSVCGSAKKEVVHTYHCHAQSNADLPHDKIEEFK